MYAASACVSTPNLPALIMFITINLIVDVLYSLLDPRVRLQDVKA